MTGPSDTAKAFMAWQAVNAERAKATSTMDPVDWKNKKIDPKSLGVEFGPVLTEAQFKTYCEQTGLQHPVMKLDQKKKS